MLTRLTSILYLRHAKIVCIHTNSHLQCVIILYGDRASVWFSNLFSYFHRCTIVTALIQHVLEPRDSRILASRSWDKCKKPDKCYY